MELKNTILNSSRLRRRCQTDELGFCSTSADVPPLKDFIWSGAGCTGPFDLVEVCSPMVQYLDAGPAAIGKLL